MGEVPKLLHTVLDTTDVRLLAEFYRELLALVYRPGDEPPPDGQPDDADWLVLTQPDGTRTLAFQEVSELRRTTWPQHDVPMQLHLDLTVSDAAALEQARFRAVSLGAEVLFDRTDDPDEPLYVFADPAATRSACSSAEAAQAPTWPRPARRHSQGGRPLPGPVSVCARAHPRGPRRPDSQRWLRGGEQRRGTSRV